MKNAITDIPGIKVGHYTDLKAVTGCTVVLCEGGAVGGVEVCGSAPGTRETDLLRPMNLVQEVHAVLLSGGSAFGLEAAHGVVRYLYEKGVGFDAGVAKVPIVPAAILFDLGIGSPKVWPTAENGYQACLAATQDPVSEGTVGAGTGATVGKILGMGLATKGGLGSASLCLEKGLIVGALAVVNAFGDVIDPQTATVLAGPRRPDGSGFHRTMDILKGGQPLAGAPGSNTTLAVVATNAPLTKEQANKVAQMAHDGLARAICPVHTMFDGDVVFALSLGKAMGSSPDVTLVGALAAEVVSLAIGRAVSQAQSLGGVPAVRDLPYRQKLP